MKKSKHNQFSSNLSVKEDRINGQAIQKNIEALIRTGFENQDSEVRAEWERLFGPGKKPDAEEFIRKISEALK